MKSIMKRIARFFRREWFLMVMIITISLIFFIFGTF